MSDVEIGEGSCGRHGLGRFRYLASELEMNWCIHIFVLKAVACQEGLHRVWASRQCHSCPHETLGMYMRVKECMYSIGRGDNSLNGKSHSISASLIPNDLLFISKVT